MVRLGCKTNKSIGESAAFCMLCEPETVYKQHAILMIMSVLTMVLLNKSISQLVVVMNNKLHQTCLHDTDYVSLSWFHFHSNKTENLCWQLFSLTL